VCKNQGHSCEVLKSSRDLGKSRFFRFFLFDPVTCKIQIKS
jgi:hypothetical protein